MGWKEFCSTADMERSSPLQCDRRNRPHRRVLVPYDFAWTKDTAITDDDFIIFMSTCHMTPGLSQFSIAVIQWNDPRWHAQDSRNHSAR